MMFFWVFYFNQNFIRKNSKKILIKRHYFDFFANLFLKSIVLRNLDLKTMYTNLQNF
ncbi:MAG: hypothetical protein RLZZ312_803 [Bacteroidota bacterium]